MPPSLLFTYSTASSLAANPGEQYYVRSGYIANPYKGTFSISPPATLLIFPYQTPNRKAQQLPKALNTLIFDPFLCDRFCIERKLAYAEKHLIFC